MGVLGLRLAEADRADARHPLLVRVVVDVDAWGARAGVRAAPMIDELPDGSRHPWDMRPGRAVVIELPGGQDARDGDPALIWWRLTDPADEAYALQRVADAARAWSAHLRAFGFELNEGTLRVEGSGVRFVVARSTLVAL